MASISKRRTAFGEVRHDVHYRAGGRAVEATEPRDREIAAFLDQAVGDP